MEKTLVTSLKKVINCQVVVCGPSIPEISTAETKARLERMEESDGELQGRTLVAVSNLNGSQEAACLLHHMRQRRSYFLQSIYRVYTNASERVPLNRLTVQYYLLHHFPTRFPVIAAKISTVTPS